MEVIFKFILPNQSSLVVLNAIREYKSQSGVYIVESERGIFYRKSEIDILDEIVNLPLAQKTSLEDLEGNIFAEKELPLCDNPDWVYWKGETVHLDEGDFIRFKSGIASKCAEPFLLTSKEIEVNGYMKKSISSRKNLLVEKEENSEEWVEFFYKNKHHLEKGDKIKLKSGIIHTLRSGADIHPIHKDWCVWVEDTSIDSVEIYHIDYFLKS